MPVNIEDILSRRTRALLLNVKASAAIASEVAQLMADEFGYDMKWQAEQIDSYNKLVDSYL
jgi:glycerol-3-phosphate dehydrogenase